MRIEREVQQRTTELEQANRAAQHLNQELETKLAQLQQLNGSLTTVDRVRDGLLATASHELRTPLSAILSSLDIIREEWNDRLPAQGQHLLEICERNSTLLMSLVYPTS
jgi:signal transduction histidine kinase